MDTAIMGEVFQLQNNATLHLNGHFRDMHVKQGPCVGDVSWEAFANEVSRTLHRSAHFGAKVET